MAKSIISRSALSTYITFAGVVFSMALIYCVSTGRILELGIVGAGVVALGVLAANTYRSL